MVVVSQGSPEGASLAAMTVPGSCLVVLAAGLGSRFGGTKQLEEVGPKGEAFLDLAIRDALDAGIERAVVVVRTDIRDDVRAHLARHHDDVESIALPCQDALGPPRAKPWGTVHAVLAAAEDVAGPFVVVNADDHYGPRSYRLAADILTRVDADHAGLVAFELDATVPSSGSVSRGVCEVTEGRLTGIAEHLRIERSAEGLRSEHGPLAPDTPVSMNMWCFDHSIMGRFRDRFERFLADAAEEPKVECLLPNEVASLMAEGVTVEVVSSPERWIGVTNPEDLELARRALAGDS